MTSHPPMQQHGKLPADPKRGASPLPSCEGHAGLPLAAGRRSTPRTQWCRLRRVQTAGAAVAVALVQRSALRLGCTVVTLRTRRERSPAPVASRGGRHGTRGTAQPRPGQGGVPTLGTASGQPSRWPRLWSRGAALLLALLFSGVLGYNQALNDLGVFTRTPAWCGQAGSAMPVAASGSEAPSKAQVTPTDGATTRGGTGLDPSPSTAPAAPWRSPSTLEMWASTAALVALCSAATLGRRRWPRPLGQRRGSRVTSPAPDALEPAEVAHGPQSPPTTAPISGLAARAQSQPEPPPGTPTAVNTVTPEPAEAAQWLAHGSGESAECIEWAPGHEAYPGQHGPAVARTPCDTGQFPLPVDSTVEQVWVGRELGPGVSPDSSAQPPNPVSPAWIALWERPEPVPVPPTSGPDGGQPEARPATGSHHHTVKVVDRTPLRPCDREAPGGVTLWERPDPPPWLR